MSNEFELILASKSKVRKTILEQNGLRCIVEPSNIDEDQIKESLLKEGASAEIKANKISQKSNSLIIGADSVIDLENEIISKPRSRKQALEILKKLNGKTHNLISSVCISKNGSMIWNHTEKATLTMKKFNEKDLKDYLNKISDENLYAYNVYQIEGEGKNLFSKIEGDSNTIMGLPIKQIKNYLESLK